MGTGGFVKIFTIGNRVGDDFSKAFANKGIQATFSLRFSLIPNCSTAGLMVMLKGFQYCQVRQSVKFLQRYLPGY